MGRQLLGEIGETDDKRAGSRSVDALSGDGLRSGVDGLRRRGVAAVPELASGGVSGSELTAREVLIEAPKPLVAVEAGQGRVSDRRRMPDQALAEAGAGLGRGQRLRFEARTRRTSSRSTGS